MSSFTYHYHANALALGGVLKYDGDVTKVVPSLASVALADSGGEGVSEIRNYNRDGVSFSHASCRVLGVDSAHKTFTTSSDVYITNLNLFGRVKAAILQTSISSTRVVTGDFSTESDPDKAQFEMHSMIRGLTIDGVEVIPQLDLELCEWPTYAAFNTEYGKRLTGSTDSATSLAVPAADAPIRASFVRTLDDALPATPGPSFKLPVPRFGNIHFGELVVKRGARRVNLLRIDFDSTLESEDSMMTGLIRAFTAEEDSGSPLGGTMTMLSLGGNGVPSWP
jgi:hypothetical protein